MDTFADEAGQLDREFWAIVAPERQRHGRLGPACGLLFMAASAIVSARLYFAVGQLLFG
jgi:hypothetical protein